MSVDDPAEATRALWRRGSYEIVGDWITDASRDVLVGAHGPLDLQGRDLLDVACGTGAVAIEAAREGARVVGVDLTPELLTVAERRAAAAGVDVTFVEGNFDNLGGFGRFDVVASSFGVMFAPEPPAVAAQLAQACRTDGTVAVAAWHRDGAFGGPPPEVRAKLPTGGADAACWAEPDQVADFFASTEFEVAVARRSTHPIPFPSPAAAVDAFLTHSGAWMAMFDALAAEGNAEDGRSALEAHLMSHSDPTADGITLRAEYSVIHLRRAA